MLISLMGVFKIPVYEYLCEKCNVITEEYVPTSSKSDWTFCSKCGEKAKKIISNSTFILKGGGWYNSGYTKDKKK